MERPPKSIRLQIAIFGRTNVGKSSFVNFLAGQNVSITSDIPGTTTDIVEKSMELLPIGPVVLLDTAGIDDISELSNLRINKTLNILKRADIGVLIVIPNQWTHFEDSIIADFKENNIPYVIVVNKCDLTNCEPAFLSNLYLKSNNILLCSSIELNKRDEYLTQFKELILNIVPFDLSAPQHILGDLIPKNGIVVFITPIDSEAPKGRLILPQVQALRDALDNDLISIVVKENEYKNVYEVLNKKPDLVVCDSQVVAQMVKETPSDVLCTTFSILFSRYKGNLLQEVNGCFALKTLQTGDKVLIAEACSHHALEDDIGRVKIPNWLQNYVGGKLEIDIYAGRDYPANIKDYKVIIHCGGCMLTRREKLNRLAHAKKNNIPITNYGLAISLIHNYMERVLEPFPETVEVLKNGI